MKRVCFVVILLLAFSASVNAQKQKDSVKKAFVFLPIYSFSKTIKPLPDNCYYSSLGFFCKAELQLEKTTKIPVKIRLGSMDECDMIEGKKF